MAENSSTPGQTHLDPWLKFRGLPAGGAGELDSGSASGGGGGGASPAAGRAAAAAELVVPPGAALVERQQSPGSAVWRPGRLQVAITPGHHPWPLTPPPIACSCCCWGAKSLGWGERCSFFTHCSRANGEPMPLSRALLSWLMFAAAGYRKSRPRGTRGRRASRARLEADGAADGLGGGGGVAGRAGQAGRWGGWG